MTTLTTIMLGKKQIITQELPDGDLVPNGKVIGSSSCRCQDCMRNENKQKKNEAQE